MPGASLLVRCFEARIGPACHLKPGLLVKFPQRLQPGAACWLAEGAWLDSLAPITIGPDAWIGPGAVVSGTVPAGAIARGNPAVVLGER
ncbi:MAG: hypothetical protein R6W06_03475 [Prochlorococcaceae cyanobacterium]